MRVLVTFAIDEEFAPWRKLRKFRAVDPILDAYETDVGELKVCVVLTGIGCMRAWDITAISLWGEEHFDACISSGLAGGLKNGFRPSDILVAGGIRDYKLQPILRCDEGLVMQAVACGATRTQAFYMSNRILITTGEKQGAATLGDAVDMESRIVVGRGADKAFARRCVAIRAISDAAQEDLPVDFNEAITPRGDISLKKVFRELARHPQVLASLVRFGVRSRRAAESLALFLDRYVLALARAKQMERSTGVAAI